MLTLLLMACTDTAPDPPAASGGGSPGQPVRFVALGDAGVGNPAQRAVAEAIARVCADRTDAVGPGCDFALYLGDNLYQEGAESPDDPQFRAKFEVPYADLSLPFYVVLGNHDYGRWTVSRARARAQLDYAAGSEKWVMPAAYYQFRYGDVAFVALDTNALYSGWVLDWDDPQLDWMGRALDTDAAWTVVFGHHTWRSNGRHGDAGSYEGVPLLGRWLERTFETHLCGGGADLYLSGHDHNRQWLAPECGVELVVSGAGAKTSPLVRRGPTPTLWDEDTTPGFAWFEIDGDTLTGVFYDQAGAAEFQRVVTRRGEGL